VFEFGYRGKVFNFIIDASALTDATNSVKATITGTTSTDFTGGAGDDTIVMATSLIATDESGPQSCHRPHRQAFRRVDDTHRWRVLPRRKGIGHGSIATPFQFGLA